MSRKKNLLDYLALTLFIMCMGLALSASLEYVTRATEGNISDRVSGC